MARPFEQYSVRRSYEGIHIAILEVHHRFLLVFVQIVVMAWSMESHSNSILSTTNNHHSGLLEC